MAKINPQIMALLRRMKKPTVQSDPSAMTIAITIRMGNSTPNISTNENPEKKQYVDIGWKPSPEGGNIGGYGD